MKKNLLLIILCFTVLGSSIAQDLTADESTTNIGVHMDGQNYHKFIYFTNNSSETMQVRWERVTNDLPAGWLSFVCIDGGSCYPPNTGASTDNEDWSIPAGESRWLEVQMRATEAEGAVPGVGTVVLAMTDKNNPNNTDSATWIGTAFSTDVDDLEVADIKIFPNPASDFIKVSNAEGVETMELYNLIGKKVKTFTDVNSSSSFNIADLPKGMYLVRLLNGDNDVLVTKRISKR